MSKASQESKQGMLAAVVKHPSVDVTLIKQFCLTFNLAIDTALFLYIENIILSASVFFSKQSVNDDSSCNSATEQLLKKAKDIFKEPSMEGSHRLEKLLLKLLQKISPYDYEMIEFVLSHIEHIEQSHTTQKGLSLLNYLQKYRRILPPSEYEINYLMTDDEDDVLQLGICLPVKAKMRLPFHALIQGDSWKVITPELNGDTVKTWTAIASVLGLSKDQVVKLLCVYIQE